MKPRRNGRRRGMLWLPSGGRLRSSRAWREQESGVTKRCQRPRVIRGTHVLYLASSSLNSLSSVLSIWPVFCRSVVPPRLTAFLNLSRCHDVSGAGRTLDNESGGERDRTLTNSWFCIMLLCWGMREDSSLKGDVANSPESSVIALSPFVVYVSPESPLPNRQQPCSFPA